MRVACADLEAIEEAAFRQHYPPGYIHHGVDTEEDLARVRGVIRQQQMLAEYARRRLMGEFCGGPEVRGCA
jgi:hypothetical protein